MRTGRRRRAVRAAVIAGVLALLLACGTAQALDPRYHTHAEVRAELLAAAAAHPEITRLDTLGYSGVYGMAIWGFKVSDNPDVDEDEPVVLYVGVHHAEEVMGLEAMMWMVDDLVTGYGVDDTLTAWVNDNEIWFVPIMNPDGHEIVTSGVWEDWRKNARDNNASGGFEHDQDGVDLNRNYDFNWSAGGSSIPASDYYRGPAAFSEPENQIMRDLCLGTHPMFSLNYHSPRSSFGDCVYYPWFWPLQGYCPDYPHIESVAVALANRTKKPDGTSFQALYGYASSGGNARNWQYYATGCVSLEMEILSVAVTVPGDSVDAYCRRVAKGSYYFFERAKGPGLTGHVTNAVTGDPIVAEVKVLEATSPQILPRMTDPTYGRYWRPFVPGTYTVEFSAPGYLGLTRLVEVGEGEWTVLDAALWPESSGVPSPEVGARIESVVPNPFSGMTAVRFAAPAGTRPRVEIHDAAGRLVADIPASVDDRGAGEIVWDGRAQGGEEVASGVYFARLVAGGASHEVKVVCLR